ncbi:NAD-binding protein [Frankia sp. Mgl5]|uniref:NAD-binding protein n=1 Tax=Frankia sp. Mgl5 TaxID=2933793 RepID=UPI00200C2F1C|nr:NAD-binding protein [Frankia sp. Mgl5]MCK9926507.1 NAD-binding protein [Frankia sp. Mgl5]
MAMGVAGPATIAGHVIVCGLNDLGLSIVEQLDAAGVRAVVVDERDAPGLRRRLERWGVTLIRESIRTPESLREAGLDTALAVVACHETDLENLQIALVAVNATPRIRIIAGIGNRQLGDQLRDALTQVRVRSVGELAGPGFVEACVRSAVIHAFPLDEPAGGVEIFAVVDEPVTGRAPFRALYGDLTPISLRRAGERLAEVCPPRDVPLAPGDSLTVLGRLGELRARGMAVDEVHDARVFASLVAGAREDAGDNSRGHGGGGAGGDDRDRGGLGDRDGRGGRDGRAGAPDVPGRARHAPARNTTRAARMRTLLATVRGELDRPFRRALAVVGALMVISTVVLALTYEDNNPGAPADFDALDALYLTVETMVTVGYGDYNFGAADGWLQAFGIGLMLLGALSIAVVYAFITNVIISRRLERALGRGRANTVRGHVILCGLGSVGVATMEGLLRAGRRIVVIERDENNRFLPVARERGVPVVIGDATVRATLLEAGLAHATTIAAVTSDGLANLETILSARETHAELRRAHAARRAARAAAQRAGGRAYHGARHDPAQSADGSPEAALRVVLRVFDATMADEFERRFGIHTARSASTLATPYFVAAALGHEVISAFYVERTPFLVARMTVRPGGGLAGPTLGELATGTRVLAVTRHDDPHSGPRIGPDDDSRDNTEDGMAHGSGASSPDYRPGRHTKLRPGDELLVVGPVTQIVDMVRRNQLTRHTSSQS